MKVPSRFIFACSLLASVLGMDGHAHAEAYGPGESTSYIQSVGQDHDASTTQRRTAVVLRFAVESQPVTDAAALSARACPATNIEGASASAAASSKSLTVDPKILDAMSNEMQKRLSKNMSVMVNPDPNAIPVGALVISGCITTANAGNAVGRLVGMEVGASHLGVHVVALARTKDGWNPLDNFDLQVKGGDLLPPLGPIGLAAHVAKDPRQTLSTDAKKLADQILKKMNKDMKAREQADSRYVLPQNAALKPARDGEVESSDFRQDSTKPAWLEAARFV